jgi:hypothetical protein
MEPLLIEVRFLLTPPHRSWIKKCATVENLWDLAGGFNGILGK